MPCEYAKCSVQAFTCTFDCQCKEDFAAAICSKGLRVGHSGTHKS